MSGETEADSLVHDVAFDVSVEAFDSAELRKSGQGRVQIVVSVGSRDVGGRGVEGLDDGETHGGSWLWSFGLFVEALLDDGEELGTMSCPKQWAEAADRLQIVGGAGQLCADVADGSFADDDRWLHSGLPCS